VPTPSYAVNLAPAVQKRLHAAHACISTLYCRNVSDDRSRVFAIVRNNHSSTEHCLMVFKFSGLKAMQSLKLLRALPIVETTAVAYEEAGVLSVHTDGQLVEQAAALAIPECDEFVHHLVQLVHVAALYQYRLDRTHSIAPSTPSNPPTYCSASAHTPLCMLVPRIRLRFLCR
jgi:hypothetical protein